jgi:hypothetical protein
MQAQSSQSQMLQESAVLLGFQNNGYTFTSLIDLKSSIDRYTQRFQNNATL